MILNINGPINSGKSTISQLLVKQLPNSIFIEVDDLLSDEEKINFPNFESRINERINRLLIILNNYLSIGNYDYIIFAYPMSDEIYNEILKIINSKEIFFVITLCPKMEICRINRGNRELNDWEKNRIIEMYKNGLTSYEKTDKFIDNTYQDVEETVKEVLKFIKNKT